MRGRGVGEADGWGRGVGGWGGEGAAWRSSRPVVPCPSGAMSGAVGRLNEVPAPPAPPLPSPSSCHPDHPSATTLATPRPPDTIQRTQRVAGVMPGVSPRADRRANPAGPSQPCRLGAHRPQPHMMPTPLVCSKGRLPSKNSHPAWTAAWRSQASPCSSGWHRGTAPRRAESCQRCGRRWGRRCDRGCTPVCREGSREAKQAGRVASLKLAAGGYQCGGGPRLLRWGATARRPGIAGKVSGGPDRSNLGPPTACGLRLRPP